MTKMESALLRESITAIRRTISDAGHQLFELELKLLGERSIIEERRIEELNFSVRTHNCLKKTGIKTVEQLAVCTEAELLVIRNMSLRTVAEVKGKLAMCGFKLRG